MAQSVARQAVNLQVAGSNPAGGDFAKVVLTQSITTISAVVQWLGYLAFTQETRVQTPAAEHLCQLKREKDNPSRAFFVHLLFCRGKSSQTAGFEPAHAEHTRLAGEPRNHLGTSALLACTTSPMV